MSSQSAGLPVDWYAQLVLLAIIGYVVALGVASVTSAQVTRNRLERFVRRHRLEITPANGNRVIAYLATTRRWRSAGLLAGLVASLGWYAWGALQQDNLQIRVDAGYLFAGWFAGALLAEARLARLPNEAHRVASLQPRQAWSYLPPWAWALVPGAAIAAVAVAAVAELTAVLRGVTPDRAVLGWLAAALVLTAVIRATQRYVLRRAQPVAEPDVIAADDAIRSRSLHVLAGGGAVLISYCALAELSAIDLPGYDSDLSLRAAQMIGVYVLAALGWIVATSTWPVRRPGASRTGGAEPMVSL